MSGLREELSQYWRNIQGIFFPWLVEALGELTEEQQELGTALELVRIEEHLPSSMGCPGRTASERAALARAFVAKAVYDMTTTRVDRTVAQRQDATPPWD